MREIMEYYAKCNKEINAAMNAILAGNLADPYALELEGYFFKRLSEILEHLFATDMIWMKAFAAIDAFGLDLEGEVRAVPGYGDRVFGSFAEYRAHREKLDDFIARYMDRLDDGFFGKTVSRTTKSGELIERPAYRALTHFFNHQTHHRGQISNILDNLKIENNYSNMLMIG